MISSVMENLQGSMGIRAIDPVLENLQDALEQIRADNPSPLATQATDASWDKPSHSFEVLEMGVLLQDCAQKDLTGEDVERVRKALKFSYQKLAKFLGHTTDSVMAWEAGTLPVPTAAKMVLRILILARRV